MSWIFIVQSNGFTQNITSSTKEFFGTPLVKKSGLVGLPNATAHMLLCNVDSTIGSWNWKRINQFIRNKQNRVIYLISFFKLHT